MLLCGFKSADVKCKAEGGAPASWIVLTGLVGICMDCRKGDINKPGGSLGFK